MTELAALDRVLQGRLSDIKTKKERADLKLNILLLSDYGLNGNESTTKVYLEDYLDFDHIQYVIQRGGSCVLIPYALRVRHSVVFKVFAQTKLGRGLLSPPTTSISTTHH